MKECPNCKELVGENARNCFNCNYDFIYGKVPDKAHLKQLKEDEEKKKNERIKKEEEENELRLQQLLSNPRFEYKTEMISDLSDGKPDIALLQQTLSKYAADGWRLHTIYTNELGKNSSSTALGGFGVSINATINETICIFERCIKPGK